VEVRLEQPAEEIKRLQRCINDLISVLALPAIWVGADPHQIVRTLLDVLLGLLSLDLVYVRMKDPIGGALSEAPIELVRVPQPQTLTARPQEIGALLNSWLRDDPHRWPRLVRNPVGDGSLTVIALRLGLQGEIGVLVAGSQRADFPEQTERLLLTVAANQAVIGLQEARLLSEQKRVTRELDQRVTQRTKELAASEQKLGESELNLRRMTETIPQMLWSATPQGVVDYCNARVLDYTGFSAGAIMGDGWLKLLHPDDVDQTVRVWMSCITTGAPYRVEVRIFHAVGRTYRWCVTTALPLLDEQGRILKWYGTIVDMHDWKHAQEELHNTRAELAHMTRVMTIGELTASIAHEVNQPLAGILTNASTCLRMLAADPPNVDGARETARRTIRDGNRASEVIKRLRSLYSKKDATTELMDLNDATREVIALSLSELQRNSVVLRPALTDDLPLILGDRVQLQQVILNLLRNASDAMSGVNDRPRQLLIRTEREAGDRVRLTVQDAGVGFDPQDVHRLFQPFYTTKNEGMGMGLSVSRSIIEGHQGRLWATLNEGPGAMFAFSIPHAA
jgi:PAS domain S-box-containing protein